VEGELDRTEGMMAKKKKAPKKYPGE